MVKVPFDEAKILGVMLTGQTENFKALENQDFIRGASVGATAQIVPYIKPDKR
ncbi:anti sigma factor C-terminal domain-containing protein [Desulfosporosinus shakirovi]|uniref:anti sigma factor C-terminal domain-containing protein n=1 Tax=Desulfosporosinus shakirovi TaxID=2885154 RepID=UPI001E3300EF|nr:anti sigma factor C-terminal domain-containing protein [Desulfosporosinus sp. SRJS8]MCB8815426.1 anti sigma factor C-terminal domain-containing protein [Desulfosporosinus sp. SRJS8]